MSVFRRGVRIAKGAHVDELPSDDDDSDTEDEVELHAREEAEVSDAGEDDSGPVLPYPRETPPVSQHQQSKETLLAGELGVRAGRPQHQQ